MRLYSYVVARDYGFAPNPFYGFCSLATCKPNIRRTAKIGDWVIGTGSSANNNRGYLVYVMKISETLTFNEYWLDTRFRQKKPNLRGSKKQAFGDNIYFRKAEWQQIDSHHSLRNGTPNPSNIRNDTQTNRILLSTNFSYWGREGPEIPEQFRNFSGTDICATRNHKNKFPCSLVKNFLSWYESLEEVGYLGLPLNWENTP